MANAEPFDVAQLTPRSTLSSQRWSAFMTIVLMICSLISVLTTLGLIVMLVYEAAGFFANEQIQLSRFFTDTKWSVGQTQGEIHYGILPLLSGTLRITAIAMLIALPLGVITAVFLSEFASPRVRSILKPALEVLAGVPTVVLGYFAMVFLTPYLLQPLGDFKTFNAASAGIAVGILCLPLVTSLAEDALLALPRSLREGSVGLGAPRCETTVKVVLPAAISGIVAAFLLALARAIGETMVVALAAGSTPTWTLDPRLQSQTMAGYIVNTFQSESVVPGSLSYYSIYSVAAVLFCLTFGITVLGQYVRRRFREEYN
ncbi:MAG: phosphate ABC transporter permease subunit PstC [Planctomycetota bacterium]